MFDPFLENDTLPSRDQWVARDEQMRRMIDAALLGAQRDTNSESESYLHSSPQHGYFISLVDEMERCFKSGCWLAVVCLGAAAIDAFSHEMWGRSKCEKDLEKINFPHIDWWKTIRNKRNSIMHINNNSDHDKSDNYDLHYYSKMTIWLVYYFFDYINYWKKANNSNQLDAQKTRASV